MLDLIRKDFVIGAVFFPGVAGIVLFVTAVSLLTMFERFGGLVPGFFVPMMFLLCLGSAFLFISIDEAFHADVLYVSLPVERWRVVAARYLTASMMAILSLLLIVGASHAVPFLLNKTDPLLRILIGPRGIFGMVLLLLLFLAIELPFVFRFGTLKGVAVALAALTGLVLGGQLASLGLKALRGMFTLDMTVFTAVLGAVRSWVLGLRGAGAYVFFFGFVLIVISLSMGLSTRFYRKRDL